MSAVKSKEHHGKQKKTANNVNASAELNMLVIIVSIDTNSLRATVASILKQTREKRNVTIFKSCIQEISVIEEQDQENLANTDIKI